MDSRKIGVLAGIVASVSLAVQFIPGWLLGRWLDEGFQQDLPLMFGSTGQTVMTYVSVFTIVGLLATLMLALGFGYAVGRQLDVVTEYRRFVRAVAVGSTGAVVLGGVVIRSQLSRESINVATIALGSVEVLEQVIEVSVLVTVGALAGAALAQFRATDGVPGQPTSADTTNESPTMTDTTADHDEQRSQSTQ